MENMKIIVNEQLIYECSRESIVDEKKLQFLDKMDLDMGKGIKIRGLQLTNPDRLQRAEFVALNLFKALSQDNEAVIGVSCAWLTNRFPALYELHINKDDEGFSVKLVEEH